MKRSVTCVVAAAIFGAVLMGQAHAQIKRDTKPPGDLTTPVQGGTAAAEVPRPRGDFTKLVKRLVITEFSASRYLAHPETVGVVGVISNTSRIATDVAYSVSTWSGGTRWKVLKSGSVTSLKPKEATAVRFTFQSPRSARPVTLKLEVRGPGEQTSQEFVLK